MIHSENLWFTLIIALFLVPTLARHAPSAAQSTGSWIFLDLESVNLTSVAHANGQDTILISSIGSITDALVNGTTCENAKYFINSTALNILGQVFQLSLEHQMFVFIGLLDMDSSLPNIWGPCMGTYAQLQGEVALLVSSFLKSQFGNSISFGWYMVEQPGLNLLQYSNYDCASDGFTAYYLAKLNAIHQMTEEKRLTLVSPYWEGDNISAVVRAHNQFMECTGMSISAPQDGVGSLNRTVIETAAFFYAASREPRPSFQLWANIETFLPKDQICESAPASRIADQIAAVNGYVLKIINFWAYNLPGAPACTLWS